MMSLIRGILDLCSANIRRVEFATQQEGLWHHAECLAIEAASIT